MPKPDPATQPWDPIASLSHDEKKRLAHELVALRALASRANRSRSDVEAAARELGYHPATIYKKLKQIGPNAGNIRNIAGAKRGYPRGTPRLHPRQVEIIDAFLQAHYLQPSSPSLSETTRLIGDQCEDEGFGHPSRAAVLRRRDLIPPKEIARRRGDPVAAHKATPHPGRLMITQPWEMYQIDHTLTDVIVVDSEYGKPIGRAWLTVALDVCSRMVAAFWVGLDPPSILRTGAAIDLTVSCKAEWLSSNGLEYDWPVRGLPKVVHSDNGRDFRSGVIETALDVEGVKPKFRPVKRPHWGGHIERLIGTLMGKCRILPGATHNSPKARGDYDSAGSARVQVSELHTWMAHEILGVYHNAPHEGLGGESPLEAWKRLTEGRYPLMPDNMEQFRVDLLPEETRTITPQGIKFKTEEYSTSELLTYFRPGRVVRIKFDPRDLRYIFVLVDSGWIDVGLRFPHHMPVPLWLRQQGLRSLPHESKRDRSKVRAATEAQRQLIELTAARKLTPRRQAERYREEQKAASALRLRLGRGAVPNTGDEEHDDDWGGLQ